MRNVIATLCDDRFSLFISVWVVTVHVSDTKTKTIEVTLFHKFPRSVDHDRHWQRTDTYTFRTTVIGVISVYFCQQLAKCLVIHVVRKLWPLHASALFQWLLWLSWGYTTSSRFPIQRNSNPFLLIMLHRRSRVDNKFSFLRFKTWCRQAPIFRGWEECCSLMLLFLNTLLASFHAASRAHRSCHSVSSRDRSSNFGALELRWWISPGQIIPSDGFWSRMSAWRTTALVNFTHRIGFRLFELFCKIDEDFRGSISWNAQPNCRVLDELHTTSLTVLSYDSCFFNMATALLSPFFSHLVLGCSSTWRCAWENFSPKLQPLSDLYIKHTGGCHFHKMSYCKFLWGNPCKAIETFFHCDSCFWDF